VIVSFDSKGPPAVLGNGAKKRFFGWPQEGQGPAQGDFDPYPVLMISCVTLVGTPPIETMTQPRRWSKRLFGKRL
jgi:hypothetical protein